MNTGHEDVKCEYCHKQAAGTLRQQIQGKIQFLLGNRSHDAYVGFREVSNDDCLSCHDRPEDNHPVFRFFEPKFTKARKKIRPHQCVSCHREHTGRRATTSMQFCKHCHGELKLRKDPISIPHGKLVKKKRWDLCLRCHDFHGNHRMKVEKKIILSHSEKKIHRYLDGLSDSPYSDKKRYKARKTPLEKDK